MTLYDERGCPHNRPKGTPCSFCEYEKKYDADGYGPGKKYYGKMRGVHDQEYLRKDVEGYDSMWWYTQTRFWMDKFFETNKANEELRAENTALREVQEAKGVG